MGGQACIRGMRIPVATIIKLIAAGKTTEEILAEYPDLQKEDITQALEYVSHLAEDKVFEIVTK